MTLSSKWTAVSFFALAAMGAASMAFAGCTVTSGTIDNAEGGTGTNTDSGTDAADGSTPTTNACPGNTKQTIGPIVSAACQSCLDTKCCSELTACFDIVPDQDAAAGGTDDCNKYTQCIPKCLSISDSALRDACFGDCDDATSPAVKAAYEALAGDGTETNLGCTGRECKTECQ